MIPNMEVLESWRFGARIGRREDFKLHCLVEWLILNYGYSISFALATFQMFSSQHNGQHVYKILTIMEALLDKVSETKQHCQNVELRGRGSWVLKFFFFKCRDEISCKSLLETVRDIRKYPTTVQGVDGGKETQSWCWGPWDCGLSLTGEDLNRKKGEPPAR